MLRGLIEELRRPATFVASSLAVLSILFGALISFYFYEKSLTQAKIFYNVQQVRIFDSDNVKIKKDDPDALTLRDVDGHVVEENVFAARIVIWNAGSGEVKNENIRVPYQLIFPGSVRLFSVNITDQEKNTFDRFEVKVGNIISWDHFDPGAAIAVRALYASQNQADIALRGFSAGLPDPQVVPLETTKKNIVDRVVERLPSWIRKLLFWVLIALIVLGFILPAFMESLVYASENWREPNLLKNAVRLFRPKRLLLMLVGLLPSLILYLSTLIDFYPRIPLQ